MFESATAKGAATFVIALIIVFGGILMINKALNIQHSKNELRRAAEIQNPGVLHPDSLVCIHDMADRIILVKDMEEPHQLKDYIYVPIQAINFFKVGDTVVAENHFICNECPSGRFYKIMEIPDYNFIGPKLKKYE